MFFPALKKEDNLTLEEQLQGQIKSVTQFGRIMDELGIEMFPASSPQAKGRIERLWETLQSRLITEFRIHDIDTLEQANKFLPSYIEKYNKQFTVPPSDNVSSFLPLPPTINLDDLLCVKFERTVDNAGVFSLNNCKFAVQSENIPPRAKVTIMISKKTCSGVSQAITQAIYEYLLKDAKAA